VTEREDVDAFLAHMASQDPEELEADRAEAWRAEQTLNDGLTDLFLRLGPPTASDTEK